jgi:hypothetical protein
VRSNDAARNQEKAEPRDLSLNAAGDGHDLAARLHTLNLSEGAWSQPGAAEIARPIFKK